MDIQLNSLTEYNIITDLTVSKQQAISGGLIGGALGAFGAGAYTYLGSLGDDPATRRFRTYNAAVIGGTGGALAGSLAKPGVGTSLAST